MNEGLPLEFEQGSQSERESRDKIVQRTGLTNGNSRLPEAQLLLQERGVLPESGEYSARELARELTRRGWRWHLDVDEATATKAYTPMGTVTHTIAVAGSDQIATLTIVLADAIRFDDERGLSLTNPYRADVVVRSADNRIVAVAEVKSRERLTSQIASAFRHDLIADGRLNAQVPFFLFLSQDVGFLWDRRTGSMPFAKPAIEFPMGFVVAHYLPWLQPNERLGGRELQLVVTEWLGDLASAQPGRPMEADRFFAGTQFLEAVEGASVASDARI